MGSCITCLIMKKINEKFTKKGFKYTQIKRKGSKAIYLQERDADDSAIKNYEVIIIKSHDGYEIGGSVIPPGEVYPSSTQWGTLGWTFSSLEDAEMRFNTIRA